MQSPGSANRALTADRIVETALSIADEGGLDALSLRRLATTLGVTPMALYRYVADKDQLLDRMAERLLRDLEVTITEGSTWQEALRRLGRSFLAIVAAHPAAPFLLSRPFDAPSARDVSIALQGILSRAGFGRRESVQLLQVLTGMLLGPAIHRATYAEAARRRSPGRDSAGRTAPAVRVGRVKPPADLGRPEDQVAEWTRGPAADDLTIDLWVAGVEQLANTRSGGD